MWWGPRTFFGTHSNQLPSCSEVHGFKYFLCNAHLLGSFEGQMWKCFKVSIRPSKNPRRCTLQRKSLKPWTPDNEGSGLQWVPKKVWWPCNTLININSQRKLLLLPACITLCHKDIFKKRVVVAAEYDYYEELNTAGGSGCCPAGLVAASLQPGPELFQG